MDQKQYCKEVGKIIELLGEITCPACEVEQDGDEQYQELGTIEGVSSVLICPKCKRVVHLS